MKTFHRPFLLAALVGATLPGLAAAEPASATAAPESVYVPCKIHQTVRPVVPDRLLRDGVIRGEADLMLEIDPEGRLVDSLLTAYTHRAFAEAAIRAVKQWRFEPAIIEGRPVISDINLKFNFENSGVVVLERDALPSRPELPSGEKFEFRTHGPATLDQLPVPLDLPRPIYPKAWVQSGRTGSVTLLYYIDESGQVRIPVVDSHSDPFLAAAAIAAVKEWRFAPPTSHGRPVLTRVEQTFVFDPKEPSPNDS